MDLHILFSIVSAMYAVLSTVMSSPASETSSTVAPARHVRNKRCSCATFLDKECVYFCHLDIIWVNTPARIVSYGLGNAPRMRRAIRDLVINERPRCTCLRENDTTCTSFCQLEKHHRENTQCKHKMTAKAGRIRMKHRAGRVTPIKAHLLQKWRAKRHHRSRAWEGESAAS